MTTHYWPGEPRSVVVLGLLGLMLGAVWPVIGGPLLMIAVARMSYILLRELPPAKKDTK